MRFLIASAKYVTPRFVGVRCMGSGPTDGKAGAIREAGGAFSELGVAREEEYFFKKQNEQLKKLKADQISQLEYRQEQVKDLEEAVERHKKSISKLQK